MKIDLVYLWVDGSDSQWQARKEKALEKHKYKSLINTEGRFDNHNELKYSLRSVEKYLPWINNIYIVTDNQKPEWLNLDNPRIKIIDHKEILPKEAMPCFNSVVIEYYMYRIPNLSEHFLYANDDMFVNKTLEPSFFFNSDGLPIARLQRQRFQKTEFKIKKLLNIPINNYRQSIKNAIDLIEYRYAMYFPGVLHHNIDAYLKRELQQLVEYTFNNEITKISKNSFRSPTDIQRVLITYDGLVNNRSTVEYTKRHESLRLKVHEGEFEQQINRYNPNFFCLNDTEHATDNDRADIEPFLNKMFPEKSSFEK